MSAKRLLTKAKTHIVLFRIGVTRNRPVLELRQFKCCLEDVQRHQLPTAGTLLQPKIVEGMEDKV